ncbi:CIA30 family protein [Luteimonas sp. RD2P54]|uniref:CIA30 family protein n=1 Tax=Luteimonas endophytica TaxID=3042023 RepID=A0ABT6JD03_9GAMM|nr:CIA30 family protein [Luteimonas endophytica]MDH5824712.1 CIA30 family protein [Luteimonas endophytica]
MTNRLIEFSAVAALVAVIVLAVVQGHAGGSAAPLEPGGNSFAVRDVRVFDGTRDLGVVTVVVRDGVIRQVATDAIVPDGLAEIDGGGRTLLPGLIDAHVHAWGEARRDAARYGVTTMLDMHGMADRLPGLRAQRESLGDVGQADLWAAGYAVTAPEGHGTQYGFPVPTFGPQTDAEAFVAARIAEGADYIKLIVEDLGAHGGERRLDTLAPDQVEAVIAAAHAANRKAVVHVSAQEDARRAIDAGADGLVHVFIDAVADPDFVASARARGAFVAPTLSVLASFAGEGIGAGLAADRALSLGLTAEQRASLDAGIPRASGDGARIERAMESVRRLHAAGVPILAGTDAPNPGTAHGISMHGELELLVRAGLSPRQALAAATSRPAHHFGLGDRGRIAPGMRADLVLVEGNPQAEITATRAIVEVWKNGYAIQRDPRAASAQGVAVPSASLVSDFDGGEIAAAFGGWEPTTDRIAGGASVAEHRIVAGGAGDSRGALAVTGEVRPGFAFPWAGVMFWPGGEPMQAVDLSGRSELVFRVRGDGRHYRAMLFSGPSMQGMPAMLGFRAGEEWSEVRLRLEDFAGADLSLLRGIAFTAGDPAGEFGFLLDDVELR